jgi:hypothetical protein
MCSAFGYSVIFTVTPAARAEAARRMLSSGKRPGLEGHVSGAQLLEERVLRFEMNVEGALRDARQRANLTDLQCRGDDVVEQTDAREQQPCARALTFAAGFVRGGHQPRAKA